MSKSSSRSADFDLIIQNENDQKEINEIKRKRRENVAKSYGNLVAILFIVIFFAAIVTAIILASVLNDGPSVYKNFQDSIKWGGSIMTNIEFKVNQIYIVPSSVSNLGRSYITLSGGGGGGCVGNYTATGGGGNSGASGVMIPVVLNANDQCVITVGIGGDSNMDGTYTEFKCIPSSGGQPTVYFNVPGGRSGCSPIYNSSDTRLGDDNYPFVSERFGSRPLNPLYAERNIYGGIGGQMLGGGAGSVFGNGGNAGDSDTAGQNAPGYGAGGGGGGISTTPGLNFNGGKGGNGLVQLNFFVRIQQG